MKIGKEEENEVIEEKEAKLYEEILMMLLQHFSKIRRTDNNEGKLEQNEKEKDKQMTKESKTKQK